MASIMELLASRNRDRQRSRPPGDRQGLVSATVLRADNMRYILSDGNNSFAADTLVSQRLEPGDRVWVAVGRGTSVIIGLMGRDASLAGS